MTLVDGEFGLWLKSEEAVAVASSAPAAARWGDLARDTRISSGLALKPDADAEGARQLAFVGGPLVIEQLWVPGRRIDMLGAVWTLTATKGGYGAGVDVFVLFVDEGEGDEGGTILTVLRRM